MASSQAALGHRSAQLSGLCELRKALRVSRFSAPFGECSASYLFDRMQKSVSVAGKARGPRDVGCERIDVPFAQRKHPIVHGNLKQPDTHEHAGC
jgi:hypothetical protein